MTVKQILVADDDPDMRNIISFKLGREGFEVTVVSDGEEALAAIEQNDYQLLILDIMMPVLDGLQVLKQVRESNRSLSVIILSAKGQEKDVVQGLNLGADDYISKPFRPAELIARVHRITGGT